MRIVYKAALISALVSTQALAAPPPVSIPIDPDSYEQAKSGGGPFAFLNSWERSNYLLGDMWGLRTLLSRAGISLAIQETSEGLGNVTGGNHRGASYDGLTQMIIQADSNRAFGYYGGLFNVSALDIHGRNLSSDNLSSLQTASGIEGDRSLRLWEVWYQQKFLDEDRLDIKIGQQSLDQEFMVSQNALYFVNTMFGWPMVPSADLPGGGPAYPLSALGIRIRAKPNDAITVLAAAFNGSPTATTSGDPQRSNGSGTAFPTHGGKLAIAEIQYAYPPLGGITYPDEPQALASLYRFGIWYDTQSFDDLRYDNTGLSLADPNSTGIARSHHGDYSLYAVVDKMLWVNERDNNRNLSAFFRGMGTPQQDRNLVDMSFNAGLVLHQPLPYRNLDTLGFGMGYAHISPQAAALDRDTYADTGSYTPVRSGETFMELTYQYQATMWCQLQPDIQYVINPGGGIASSVQTSEKVADELVFGVRTNILF